MLVLISPFAQGILALTCCILILPMKCFQGKERIRAIPGMWLPFDRLTNQADDQY